MLPQKTDKKISSKRFVWRFFLVFLFLFLALTLWPIRNFFPAIFTGDQIAIIFTNETEERPCGGFITAYALIDFFPPRAKIHNVYELEPMSFGKNIYPLTEVSDEKKFWDLGTTTDIRWCQKVLLEAIKIPYPETDEVMLVSLKSVENLVEKIYGDHLILGKYQSADFFSLLSRSVSDIDRHAIKDLDTRKNILGDVGREITTKLFLHPWKWPSVTHLIADAVDRGEIFTVFSPDYQPKKYDFQAIEWNLGGGKSSRYLHKKWIITAREEAPNQWKFSATFTASHLGGYSEPISQKWKGIFEFYFPDFFHHTSVIESAEINPGETFTRSFEFENIEISNPAGFGIFRPRGQELFAEIFVTAFSEQKFQQSNLNIRENLAIWSGEIMDSRKFFYWESIPDSLPPFITLHEVVPSDFFWSSGETIPSRAVVIEVHFQEPILIDDDFSVRLQDWDIIDYKTNIPQFLEKKLLDDNRTLLLAFDRGGSIQKNERYGLFIRGISDLWGNKIIETDRTIIEKN